MIMSKKIIEPEKSEIIKPAMFCRLFCWVTGKLVNPGFKCAKWCCG